MWISVRIRKHERGLWFRHGDFKQLLAPGRNWLWSRLWTAGNRVELVDTLNTRFEHPLLPMLLKEEPVARELPVVDLTDTQRTLVWKDERLLQIVGPGRHAYWNSPAALRVETFSIDAFRFAHPRLAAILQHADAPRWRDGVQIDAGEEALLYRDGVLIETLRQGLHVFWKGTGKVAWKPVDRREQVADVAGQEIMTSDRVTLRVNLLVTYQVVDPLKSVTTVSDSSQALYRDAQIVLRGRRHADSRCPAGRQGVGWRRGARGAGQAYGGVRRCRPQCRSPGHHPPGRHEDAAQPGNRGHQGGRGQPDPPARRDGRQGCRRELTDGACGCSAAARPVVFCQVGRGDHFSRRAGSRAGVASRRSASAPGAG